MKVGVSSRDITPPTRTGLADHTRYSTGVNDPLFAKALVLDDGESVVAIVCLDLVCADVDFCDGLREQIRERTGIEQTLVNFTHTHSAPMVTGTLSHGDEAFQWEPHELAWLERLQLAILEAVEDAYAHRAAVSLRAGRAPAQIGFNRRLADENGIVTMRVNKDGAVVPWVNVLQACAEDGRTLAVLFEHACHPVIVHRASSLIGADYPGFAVQRIQEELGENVTAIFAQGCGANINGYPLQGGHQRAEEAGRTLGDAALEAVRESREIRADKLGLRSGRILLPGGELPSLELWEETVIRFKRAYGEYEAHLRGTRAKTWLTSDHPHFFSGDVYRSTMKRLRVMRDMIERGEPGELPLEISAVMLGSEWCLVALQHEMFCEYELWIDHNAPFDRTMVLGYTNGPGDVHPHRSGPRLGREGRLRGGISAMLVVPPVALSHWPPSGHWHREQDQAGHHVSLVQMRMEPSFRFAITVLVWYDSGIRSGNLSGPNPGASDTESGVRAGRRLAAADSLSTFR